MKANRTTFLAIFCLCFFTISFGENATVQKKSKKVLKQTKKSITFVVDEDLPAPKQTFSTMSSDQLCTYIIYKKMPSADPKVVKNSFNGEELCYLGEDNFYKCIVQAFADHRSLVLSPDVARHGVARHWSGLLTLCECPFRRVARQAGVSSGQDGLEGGEW